MDTCAVNDVELVYLVDDSNGLFSFDPRKLPGDPFRRIGKLACDSSSTPNSMSVDRSGIAWIGYQNGKVYHASILDAQCSKEASTPRGAPRNFGMGFVTVGPKSTTEKLFVTGFEGATILATLDTKQTPITWNEVTPLQKQTADNPELTGTGDGKLFAYFPAPDRGFVQELERSTGKRVGTKWTLRGGKGEVYAYAFAHWGGVFYVFTTVGKNSAVHAIHMKDGKQELVKENLPYVIVGAGVSTCAPLLERAPE